MADGARLTIKEGDFTRQMRRFMTRFQQDAERVVFETATDVLADIVEGWPVDTGVSRGAWRGPVKGERQFSYRLTNPMPYAAVIEFGGYPGVGPKTEEGGPFTLPGGIQIGGGIFPTQKPHAPVRRAQSKNRGQMTKRLQLAMQRRWGR